MAVSQDKRSIHRSQPARRSVATANTVTAAIAPKSRISIPRRQKVFRFPEAEGQVLEGVEFASSSSYHAISLYFKNQTALDLIIDPCFTVHADYLDRKGGASRAQEVAAHARNAFPQALKPVLRGGFWIPRPQKVSKNLPKGYFYARADEYANPQR